jgi:hypothetical protein
MPQPIAALTLKFAQFRREGTLSCGSGKKTMCIALAILTLLADARQFWICTARYNFQDLTATTTATVSRAISAGPCGPRPLMCAPKLLTGDVGRVAAGAGGERRQSKEIEERAQVFGGVLPRPIALTTLVDRQSIGSPWRR